MEQRDVERIVRDVISTQALPVALRRVDVRPTGWQVTITDHIGAVLTTDLPDGPPAAIRTALTRWLD